ncbi:hypothetical protein HispidOSU_023297 [Sigmodon hispidus]
MVRLTQPGVRGPSEPSARGPLRPHRAQHRPQPSATLPSGRCPSPSRADAQFPAGRCVLSCASSAPPPPPSLPGASARAEPDGHPGTGGRRASRTSFEPGDQRCPPPGGTLGSLKTTGRVPAARRVLPTSSPLALGGRSARPSAPLELPELAGSPPAGAAVGSELHWRSLPLRMQTRALLGGPPELGLGPRRPGAAAGLCGERATEYRPPYVWPPRQGLPSEAGIQQSNTLLSVLSLVLRDKCLHDDFPLGET